MEVFDAQVRRWRAALMRLESVLAPIANRPVDTSEPGWQTILAALPHPADEADVRKDVVALFDDIIDHYAECDAVQRQEIIDLLAGYRAVMYSALITQVPDAPRAFFRSLLLLVLEDQGLDRRDALVQLSELRRQGHRAGLDVDDLVRRAAEVASPIDRHGWGSTRDLLLGTIDDHPG